MSQDQAASAKGAMPEPYRETFSVALPFVRTRYHLTVIVGAERRPADRLQDEQMLRPTPPVLGNVGKFLVTLLLAAGFAVMVAQGMLRL